MVLPKARDFVILTGRVCRKHGFCLGKARWGNKQLCWDSQLKHHSMKMIVLNSPLSRVQMLKWARHIMDGIPVVLHRRISSLTRRAHDELKANTSVSAFSEFGVSHHSSYTDYNVSCFDLYRSSSVERQFFSTCTSNVGGGKKHYVFLFFSEHPRAFYF